MANNTYIFRRGLDKNITKKEIFDVLTEINDEHFDGVLPITESEDFNGYIILPTEDRIDAIVVMCLDNGYTEWDEEKEDAFPVSGTHIEFTGRHCPFYSWLDDIFSELSTHKLGAEYYNEGIGLVDINIDTLEFSYQEKLQKQFYNEKTDEFYQSGYDNTMLWNEESLGNGNLDPYFYELLVTESIKKRNEAIDTLIKDDGKK